ncbi:MAG: secretion protein F, partial [Oscillospiraceae bacterium]|nr:secretion protein F [Oscillospiraceae bacterium]
MSIIIGALCGIGLFYIFADIRRIPHAKTSCAIINLSKSQKGQSRGLDVWLGGFALWLSKH